MSFAAIFMYKKIILKHGREQLEMEKETFINDQEYFGIEVENFNYDQQQKTFFDDQEQFDIGE